VTHGQQWPRWDVVRLEQDGGAGRCIVAESVRIEAMPEPAWTAALDMAHAGTANGVNANHSLRVSTHVSSPDTVVWTATALGDGGECDDNHDASDCRRCKTLFGDIEPRWAGAMRAARDLYYLRDVRAWVATQLRALAAGCPLRDGVYLVLRDRLPEVERIDAALEAAGAGRLTRWDVLDCDAARANARKANEETLAALMDGVVGAARQLRDGKRLHADKLAATIEEAHELIDRARWLRDVLGCATEQIEAAAEGARDVLREVAARVGVTTPAAPAGGAS
jgi:hypothetical protein